MGDLAVVTGLPVCIGLGRLAPTDIRAQDTRRPHHPDRREDGDLLVRHGNYGRLGHGRVLGPRDSIPSPAHMITAITGSASTARDAVSGPGAVPWEPDVTVEVEDAPSSAHPRFAGWSRAHHWPVFVS